MKRIITMIIEDGTQATVEATACSNEGGNVFITASTLPEAQALIATGAAQLTEAMKDWQPVEKPAQDQRHYYVMSRSVEEMQEAAQEYEESPEGRRFAKAIENAKEFTLKHSKGGLRMMQLNYLANRHYNSLLNGSFELMALAYRRGYKQGQKAAGKKI